MAYRERFLTVDKFQDDFSDLIKAILGEYQRAADEGLDKAAEIMKASCERHSPVGNSTRHYRDLWAIESYPRYRYVGNRKVVGHYKFKDRAATTIPLINILEYSYEHGHPHVNEAFDACYQDMVKAIEDSIKRVAVITIKK